MMCQKVFLEVDTDGSGLIDYNEFRTWFVGQKDGKGGHAAARAKRKQLAADGAAGAAQRAAETTLRLSAQLACYCADDAAVTRMLATANATQRERVRSAIAPRSDVATLRSSLPSIAAKLERDAARDGDGALDGVGIDAAGSDGASLLHSLLARGADAVDAGTLRRLFVEAPLTARAALTRRVGARSALIALGDSAFLSAALTAPVVDALFAHGALLRGGGGGANMLHAICANVQPRRAPRRGDGGECSAITAASLGGELGCCTADVVEELLGAPPDVVAAMLRDVDASGRTPFHVYVAANIATLEARFTARDAAGDAGAAVAVALDALSWLIIGAEHEERSAASALAVSDSAGRTALDTLCATVRGARADVAGALAASAMSALLAAAPSTALRVGADGALALHRLAANPDLGGDAKAAAIAAYTRACPRAQSARDASGRTAAQLAAAAESDGALP